MLREYRADLHLHTCLSPCGDLGMSPAAIVKQAAALKLNLIAVCDHNTTENSPAVIRAATDKGLKVLPGMEITTSEEVHIIALFGEIEDAWAMQALVYENLTGENDEKVFGMQPVVDENGWVLGFNPRLLIGAIGLPVQVVVHAIHEHQGLAIAAHIDREAFGIIGQLGFIPEDLELDALEISANINAADAREKFNEYQQYALITASDAHYLKDVGRCITTFRLEQPTVKELRMAFRGEQGREIII